MSVYNCKSTDTPDTYLFTKFDDDLNIVDDSVYLTSLAECTCPAGQRASCRHRQMLPQFLAADRIDSDYFYCFETSDWSQPFEALDDSELAAPAAPLGSSSDDNASPESSATAPDDRLVIIDEASQMTEAMWDLSVRELDDSDRPPAKPLRRL